MGLESIFTVNISLSAAAPSKPSFGAALIAAYHSVGGSQRVLGPYSQVSDIVSAGFATNSPVVLAATKYFAQSPTPTQLFVGRRANPFTQKVKLTPLSHSTGDVYNLVVGATGGVGGTQITYTVPSSTTLATVCTALASAISAQGNGVADGSSGTFIEWTANTAGQLTEFQNQTPPLLTMKEDTADPGIAADLAAIWSANQNWYGLVLDSNSQNEVLAAAAWVESNKRIFVAHSSDTAIADNTSTLDVEAALKAASYMRTGLLFVQNTNMSYAGAAWLGNRFTADPGSDTWAFKTLPSVTVDSLPPGWDTVALSKNASVYTTMNSVSFTRGGKAAGGEWLDVVRGIDWNVAEIQINLLTMFLNNSKIPFDDTGIELVANNIRGSLAEGVTNKLYVAGSTSVTVPLLSQTTATDRGNRVLNGVKFSAQLAGAVHQIPLQGTVTQ